jgi:hypothetical protein
MLPRSIVEAGWAQVTAGRTPHCIPYVGEGNLPGQRTIGLIERHPRAVAWFALSLPLPPAEWYFSLNG